MNSGYIKTKKQMIRILKVYKANLAISKMNTDFYLQILINEERNAKD